MSKNNQNKKKVICVGWHKTGTSTIGDALLILGYNVVGARLDLAKDLLENNYDKVIAVANQYDALQDVPWAVLYRELDSQYPNSKFILTLREEQDWLNSAKKHFKDSYTDMRKWIYGIGVLKGNEDIYLERYKRHNKEVEEYFKDRPDDILVMDFKKGDAWDKLCKFLNLPVPKKNFPHSNKGKHSFTLKDKIVDGLRQLSPGWLKKLGLEMLIKLGFPDKRDRFNNKQYNNAERKKREKTSGEL